MVTIAVGPDELDPQPAASAGASATSNHESGSRRKDRRGIASSLRAMDLAPIGAWHRRTAFST